MTITVSSHVYPKTPIDHSKFPAITRGTGDYYVLRIGKVDHYLRPSEVRRLRNEIRKIERDIIESRP